MGLKESEWQADKSKKGELAAGGGGVLHKRARISRRVLAKQSGVTYGRNKLSMALASINGYSHRGSKE